MSQWTNNPLFRTLLTAACGVMCLCGQAPEATVHLAAILPFGGPARGSEFYLRGVDRPERDFSGFGQETTLEHVPYGYYRLRVKNGEHTSEQLIRVNDDELWFRVGVPILRMNDAGPGGVEVKGKVVSEGKIPRGLWVRIEGVYFDVRRDCPIQHDGTFHIGGLDAGAHLLMVLDGQKIIYSRTLDVGTQEAATIRVVVPGRTLRRSPQPR